MDDNEQKQAVSINLIKEIEDSIVSPNPDFDQLKQDLETLTCGKKCRAPEGMSLAKWVDYETDFSCAEEGISGNPNWTKESLGGVALEDPVHEAEDVFPARKLNAIREKGLADGQDESMNGDEDMGGDQGDDDQQGPLDCQTWDPDRAPIELSNFGQIELIQVRSD
jgi:hypothetical protein